MAKGTPPPPAKARVPWSLLGALLLIFAVYLTGAVRIAAARSVWSPDCGARLIQVQSVLQHWPDWQVSYPAKALDPNHQNSPLTSMSSNFEYRYQNKTYIFYSFLFALISAVFFRLWGFLGLAFLPLLGGVGAALATCGLARLLRLRFPVVPLLVVALLTPLALYSVVFWDHSITTGVAALCFYLAVRAVATGERWPWFAAGVALGAGLWFHEILIPILPALVVGAWWARHRRPWLRNSLLLFCGTALLVIPLALVNQAIYGTPSGPHLSNNQLGSAGAIGSFLLKPDEWISGALYTLFGWGNANPAYTSQLRDWIRSSPQMRWEVIMSLWMALPFVLWIVLAVSGLWRRSWGWIPSLLLFAGMIAAGVWVTHHEGVWSHSLFYVCPLLALAFARQPRDERKDNGDDDDVRLLWWVLGVITAVYALVALLKPTLGGTEWGSRYLLITVPALTLFAWSAVESLLPARGNGGAWRPGAKPILAGIALLTGMTVWLQFYGFRTIEETHWSNRRLADALEQTPDEVIVSAVWWAPLNAAPAYFRKKILYAGDADHPAGPLFERMRAANVRTYTLLGFSPLNLSDFSRPLGYVPLANTHQPTVFGLHLNRYLLLDLPEPPTQSPLQE